MPPLRSFNTWVIAIGGIALLFAIIMLFRALYQIRFIATCLDDPVAAHVQLAALLWSLKCALLGIPFGTGLVITGIVGRFRRYLDMLEQGEIQE